MVISSSYFLGVNFKTAIWMSDSETWEVQKEPLGEKINSLWKKEPQRKTSLLCWLWTKLLFSDSYLSDYLHLWVLLLPDWRGQPWEVKGCGKKTWALPDIIGLLTVALWIPPYLEFWILEIMNFSKDLAIGLAFLLLAAEIILHDSVGSLITQCAEQCFWLAGDFSVKGTVGWQCHGS